MKRKRIVIVVAGAAVTIVLTRNSGYGMSGTITVGGQSSYSGNCSRRTASAGKEHRKRQTTQRLKAASAWADHDLVFATPFGRSR